MHDIPLSKLPEICLIRNTSFEQKSDAFTSQASAPAEHTRLIRASHAVAEHYVYDLGKCNHMAARTASAVKVHFFLQL